MESKKKILIVEDETALLNALRDELKREGFLVTGAKNGKEGLEIALREQPNLILLDIIMPVMDGMDMLREIRKDKWGKKVPVIVLTNLSSSEKVADMMDNEVFEYLVKANVKIGDVVAKVKERTGS